MLAKVSTSIGQAVRNLREERGISVTELCRRARVSRQTLTGLEQGYPDQQNPKIDTVDAIARALGVETVDLLRHVKARRRLRRAANSDT